MKILVTGATGYLGGHFCEYLQNKGHEVVGFIRNPQKAGHLEKLGIPYKLGDLTDLSTIIDAMQTKYDLIINSAGYVNDRGPLQTFRELNVETTRNIAQAMTETGHDRLIHISSVAAYGDFGPDIDENYTPTKHKWFKYGLTKLESEEVLDQFDLDVTILRPPHIIGTRDRTGYVPVLYHSLRKSGTWIEGGETQVPVVYVGDVCQALEVVMNHESTIGETYNVSSDDDITIKEIVQILHEILGMKVPTKSMSFRWAYTLALISEFLAKFGLKPSLTRMGVIFAAKDASFPSDKLKKLGWNTTKTAEAMVREWANWRKEFEKARKNK